MNGVLLYSNFYASLASGSPYVVRLPAQQKTAKKAVSDDV